MDTLTVIIIGVVILLIFDALLIIHLKRKKKDRFKLIIEKGIITKDEGNIPSEFLYDVQQLSRINKPDALIINGSHILSSNPKLEFKGIISPELKIKIEDSLKLSLQ